MKRFRKVYLEISNVCNLSCTFCPGTKRAPRIMTEEEFTYLLQKIQPWTDFVYFHIMGEPLCHPLLGRFLEIAQEIGMRVILTTNGTRIAVCSQTLLSSPALHKVNLSLHAFESNDKLDDFDRYLDDCFTFGKTADGEKIVVYRLWNQGGNDRLNENILSKMECFFPKPWRQTRTGIGLAPRTFLEFGDKFDWPELTAPDYGENRFCYALRDQIGVLCDGTVVPCCLDHDGDIPLGNLFHQSMDDIISSFAAKKLYKEFSDRKVTQALCRRCGYANRF